MNSPRILWIGVLFACVLSGHALNTVSYFGGSALVEADALFPLSDGTVLLSGSAGNLNWIPGTAVQVAMPAFTGLSDTATTRQAFIARLSADYSKITHVLYWPKGNLHEVKYIKGTNLPSATTGDLFFSGAWYVNTPPPGMGSTKKSGYYIAKLNNNFINGIPSGITWVFYTDTTGDDHTVRQPWDVTSDGKVYYVQGTAFGDWTAVYRLSASGVKEVVENWTYHEGVPNVNTVFTPASKYAPQMPTLSAIVFKPDGRCVLRSWTPDLYNLNYSDGNGYTKKGKWPVDYFYNSACDPAAPSFSGPGYTGYKFGGGTARIGAITVDRRTNDLYIGFNFKSVLPGGSPDFEPAVIKFSSTGVMLWWSRLYKETTQNSSPDQYVDALNIDFATNAVVVLARCHGNNVINFWSGNQIAAKPGANGFQNSFTGSNGNIHLQWLGKLLVTDGTLQASTYLGEWQSDSALGPPSSDPNLDGFPSPNSGWPNLQTTRCGITHITVGVDATGRVYVACVGQRVITTLTAFQKMLKPTENSSWANWSAFVRVYSSDLSNVVYSSLLTGNGAARGLGGSNTDLKTAVPLPGGNGVLTLGYHSFNTTANKIIGLPVPQANIPSWGDATADTTAFFAKLEF